MTIRMTAAEARRAGLTVKKQKRKRRKVAAQTSPAYPLFERLCAEHGLPIPYREIEFCEGRRWRWDFSWNDPKAMKVGPKVALEVEGGIWLSANGKKSRHFTGIGALADMAKYNEAICLGWRFLRCTPQDIESGAVFALLKRVFS